MLALLAYYLVLPLLCARLLLRFIRKYGADPVPPEVRLHCARDPILRGMYRVAELERAGGEPAGLLKVGDYETQDSAVEAAYLQRRLRPAPGREWLVLDHRGDVLQQLA